MTINEIAKMAGVSRTTVSRYLNKGYVSEEKAQKIREVIEKTGYQPSPGAQMLRTRRTKMVGVIIPKLNSDSISRMVDGISAVLSKSGYQMILANTNNHEEEELKFLKLFSNGNSVDGVILIGTILTAEHNEILSQYPLPLVLLGQQSECCTSVYYDDYRAARQLCERLTETGKKIGYIGVTERDEAAGHRRKQAFLDVMQEKGLPVEASQMVETGFRVENGYDGAKLLLEQYPEADSIFCATDSIAVGAMVALREAGKKIPEEIQIVGIGDTEKGRVVTPRLTTVHYYYRTSGKETARLILSMMNGHDPETRSIKMGCKLLEHASVRNLEKEDLLS